VSSVTTVSADPRRTATVLHTSDVHLGADERANEERAFAAAIALARRERVDAVLIVGDLFDHARVSADTLAWTAAQLGSLPCPVVLLPGNHDVLDELSVYRRFDGAARPANMLFIDDAMGQLVSIPDTDLVVWARAMPQHEPAYRPFLGLPAAPADRWTIAAGHGLVMEDGSSGRSSPIFESDLAAVTWDYVALGHVHAYREVREHPTPVRYPGATATSREGRPGVVLVDFVPGTGARPRWVGLG
jgi:DNA repair protein SbcD/Mre11